MSIKTMANLLNRQEEERKDLAAGAYVAWQALKEKEIALLNTYDGQIHQVSQEVQDTMEVGRVEYFKEWGSDGRLAVLMAARHSQERAKLIERMDKVEQLQQIYNRRDDNSQSR